MKALLKHISLWLFISAFMGSCAAKRQPNSEEHFEPTEMPRPATTNQSKTDSIKHQLNLKRKGL
jgi:hypothetical protein